MRLFPQRSLSDSHSHSTSWPSASRASRSLDRDLGLRAVGSDEAERKHVDREAPWSSRPS